MDKKEYLFKNSTSLSEEEKKSILAIIDEYGFSLSATVIYLVCETAVHLRKKKVKKISLSTKENKNLLIREALNLYTPFYRLSTPVQVLLQQAVPTDYEEVVKELDSFGISNLRKYYRAIIKAIIKYPREASSLNVFGTYSKKNVGVLDSKKLHNKELNSTITLAVEDYNVLKSIAEHSQLTVSLLISNTIKVLCDTEFYNRHTPENGEILREVILSPPRIPERYRQSKRIRTRYYLCDLKYSVQTIYIINKYHIPSLNDLAKRIVYFIIKSYQGETSLHKVRITDNEDYNETMLIRKAYRRELYADIR